MAISRRDFIKKVSILTIGLSSFSSVIASASNLLNTNNYKKLKKDLNGILNLPIGFSYSVISKLNDKMDDGLRVPNAADGMGCFKGPGNNIILVRNHELGHFPITQNFFKKNPYGRGLSKYIKKNKNRFYDIKKNKTECFGGTTTVVYNMKSKKIINQHLSLAGTLVNCSGGQTPWNTWISCEETVKKSSGKITKNHGYNFEVIPFGDVPKSPPKPLKSMGRFRHEAVAFHPKLNYVYQTEDREDGLFYRFIPDVRTKLDKGGKLQGLSLANYRGPDCRNWKNDDFKIGQSHKVRWITLDDVTSPDDDLRIRGRTKGCAIFARGEGMWSFGNYVYFTCTSGGKSKLGQIWRYKHLFNSRFDGELELFYESKSKDILKNPDNITISPWGDLIVSEDGKGHDRLIGIKPNGESYLLAENIFNKSEFAGAVFSPNGKTLFVNIYDPTMTIAIEGPWNSL